MFLDISLPLKYRVGKQKWFNVKVIFKLFVISFLLLKLKLGKKVFEKISEMLVFLPAARGACLCLIDSSWQAEPRQGNERESIQTSLQALDG